MREGEGGGNRWHGAKGNQAKQDNSTKNEEEEKEEEEEDELQSPRQMADNDTRAVTGSPVRASISKPWAACS